MKGKTIKTISPTASLHPHANQMIKHKYPEDILY